MINPSVILLILFLIVIGVVIYILSIYFPPLRKKMTEWGGQFNKKGDAILEVDGRQVILIYTPGSRHRRPEFQMSVPGKFAAELTIRTETSQDGFYKKIGFNREVQIADQELNERFYFECDVEEFLKQVFLNSKIKPLVLNILSTFTTIEITEKRCTFKQYPSIELSNLTKEQVIEDARKLLALANAIPPLLVNPHPEVRSFKLFSMIAYVLSSITLAVGIIAWAWGSHSYRVVNSFEFWNASLIWSLLLIGAFSYLFYLKIKGFSKSARVLTHCFIMFSVGAILFFRFGGAIANGVLDHSVIKRHDQQVINKYKTRHKDSTTYHIVVQSWHSGKPGWKFTVSQHEYNQADLHSTHYIIQTQEGHYGFEWIVSEKLLGQFAPSHKSSYVSSTYFPSKDYSRWYPLPSFIKGMDPQEFAYWQKWRLIMEEGITNRMGVQESLDKRHSEEEYRAINSEYRRRQEAMLAKLSALYPPERLRVFQDYVVNAGYDQIRFYADYARAKILNPERKFDEFRGHEDLKAGDQKLWAAYYYFQSLYPNRNQPTNDAIERCLAWFDIV